MKRAGGLRPLRTGEVNIGPFCFHRKEQWDLKCDPWLCVHYQTANSSSRWFCLCWGILQIGGKLWMWGKHRERARAELVRWRATLKREADQC